jgi:NhaA family Na+:H+ antiporter
MVSKQRKHVEILQEFSIPLVIGVIFAIIWSNFDNDSYYALIHWPIFELQNTKIDLHFLVNDVFMCLFFGIAAKEITEACLPGGSLNPPKKAVNPLLGTLGGIIGPVCVYFVCTEMFGDPSIKNGWGIPTATDIALAWLVARIVFGKTHPAVKFLLLLAVADDAIGLGIIAIFYPDPNHPVDPRYLLIVLGAMILAWFIRSELTKRKSNSYWQFLLCGVVSWYGFHSAHLHPALALVPIVPFMPNMGYDEGIFAEEGSGIEHTDALNRFEHAFKLPVDIGLLFFGIVNAGVQFSSIGNATWSVLISLVVGKTMGITCFSMLGHFCGFNLPEGMTFKSLFITGLIAALGLTVALFVAGVAFTDETITSSAKMGALFSAGIAPVAILLSRMLKVKKEQSAVNSMFIATFKKAETA